MAELVKGGELNVEVADPRGSSAAADSSRGVETIVDEAVANQLQVMAAGM